ncbi:MAG TPA: multicopper oxidase domain-containing protein [Longimicrobium sp.]|nr:multicopper oxidase domain-containing protein [Longimicrobium sp.]
MDPTQDSTPAGAEEPAIPGLPQKWARPTRREFVMGALAVSGLAWTGLLDIFSPAEAAAHVRVPLAPTPEPLRQMREIASEGGRLRGVITIRNAERTLPGTTRRVMMRYLEGKDAQGNVVWPPSPQTPVPGPTLRARVGDQVQLTFLNHVQVDDFAGSMDRAERGDTEGCDRVVDGATERELYPGQPGTQGVAHDSPPNCFHGSSTSNLHFHGTHITPDGLGDNILLQLRPNPGVTEASVKDDFEAIFQAGPPERWSQLPEHWRQRQLELLGQYDDTAIWQGKRGTPGNPALPPDRRLLPPTEARIAAGQWPQYQVGAYPYAYQLTPYTTDAQGRARYAMGQAPGTHWYHAHKHGSTAINVYNGMAGAFIIEGEYDDTLKHIYPDLKQQVLLVQNFNDAPALTRASRAESRQDLWVNGQKNPAISMQPGEVQLWRLVNASVRSVTTLLGFIPVAGAPAPASNPEMRQIAQDGVQFRYENYRDQPRLPGAIRHAARANAFAAGNRIDLLVKAPAAGSWVFRVSDINDAPRDLFTVTVGGSAVSMDFPKQEQFPAFPPFLGDIRADEVRKYRTLDFGWETGRAKAGLTSSGAPQFMIDGRQFEGDHYDQTMVLGDVEEWTIFNTTAAIPHPFHIHVNPFQVVEIYDPASKTRYKPTENFLWQDVIAIPPSVINADGTISEENRGYVKIRHRFVDFTGSYVLHCHMLAHEDRGMMQLVRVIPSNADIPHH